MIYMPQSLIKRVPYVGSVVSGVGLALDVKEIVENSTPIGTAKIITGRIVKECTPPELLIAGKCVMPCGGVIASVCSGGNPLVVSGTLSVSRSTD